jgi:hypothetical protein
VTPENSEALFIELLGRGVLGTIAPGLGRWHHTLVVEKGLRPASAKADREGG